MSYHQTQVFSAHDSTLFGLISAFALSAPAAWPEYGATLKIELWLPRSGGRVVLRFLLNDEVLRVGEGREELVELQHVRPREWLPHHVSKDEL